MHTATRRLYRMPAADATPARVIGVLGAGTMGSGIAQLAARSGARTLLHDPVPDALARGVERARDGLTKEAAKGRLSAEEADAAAVHLEPVDSLEALAESELVIEAAPERLELKHELYRQLSEIVGAECVLASNTSSLLVTAIAAGATHPERVVGMHFFNPAPLMRLLEVVAGEQSSEDALALAHATGAAMGKTVIRAHDGPGFLVNRCNRPFGLEALRLIQEQVADIETIDRIVRLGGGFRMGPFELMDLVGIDTGFEISKSFYEQSFYEPRWQPSPISARYVAAGLHGRKTGRGYYDYSGGASAPHRPDDPEPPQRSADTGAPQVQGDGPLARELRGLASGGAESEDAGARSVRPGGAGPQIVVEGLSGTVQGEPFYAITPSTLVEVTGEVGERAFQGLGLHTARVRPSPVGVLPRIVCQVINECAFAFGEGVGDAQDIDTGMVLGLSYPRGPLAWADAIGLDHVLAALDRLWEEYREERYRPAPALRRLARAEDAFTTSLP
jgi:3-hydroxybutyryl-CoA dehydrogenase